MNNLITQSDYWYEFEVNGKIFRLHHSEPEEWTLTNENDEILPAIKIGKDRSNPSATPRRVKKLDCLLLKFFIEKANQFHTSKEIYNQVWTQPKRRIANKTTNKEATVSGRIFYLRKFLGDEQQTLIQQGQKNNQIAYQFNGNAEIKHRILHSSTLPESQPQFGTVICPYRGLSTYTEEHAQFFKGRDAAVTDLLDAVKKNPFTVYTSASGVGKTSTIFAGLIPKLRKDDWIIVALRPQSDPFHSLTTALVRFLYPEKSEDQLGNKANQLAGNLRKSPSQIWNKIVQIRKKNGGQKHLLLVIDQFEDIYASFKQETARQGFFNGLYNFIEHLQKDKVPVGLLISMRIDILERLPKDHKFTDAAQQAVLLLKPMTREEMLDAIVKPAKESGLEIETGLPERILDELGEGGRLPLLSFTLEEIWKLRDGAELTHAAYDEIGNVKQALAKYAETLYSEMDTERQELLRNVMLSLVEVSDPQLERSRRLIRSDKFNEQEWELIEELKDERLLTINLDEISRQETVELTHETLMSAWERYKNWIEENRDYLLWRNEFEKAFKKFKEKKTARKHKHKTTSENNFLQGEELKNAVRWLTRIKTDKLPHSLKDDEENYILLSRKNYQRKRRRNFAWMGGVPLIIILLIATIFWLLNSQSSNKNEALARDLLAHALEIKKDKPDLLERSILLAIESYKRIPSPETYQFIHENLSLLPELKFSVPHSSHTFSPDGQYLITTGEDKTVKYWNIDYGQEVKKFTFSSGIRMVKISRDGKYLALASDKNTALIVDAETGKQLAELPHPDTVHDIVLSPNGKFLATQMYGSGENLRTVKVWSVPYGNFEKEFIHRNGMVRKVIFSPDNRFVVVSIDDMNDEKHSGVHIWDLANGEEIYLHHDGFVMDIQFSPDGKYLATGGKERFVRLYDVKNWKEVRRLVNNEPINALDFSADGRLLVTGNELYIVGTGKNFNTSRVFEVESGREISNFKHEDDVHSVAMSPDGKYVVSGSYNAFITDTKRTARVWEAETGVEIARMASDGSVYADFSPDGKFVIMETSDYKDFLLDSEHKTQPTKSPFVSRVKVWNPFSIPLETSHLNGVMSGQSSISKNRKFLIDVNQDNFIKVWNLHENKEIARIPYSGNIFSTTLNNDGKFIALNLGRLEGIHQQTITYVWNTETRQQIFNRQRDDWGTQLELSPDGKYLAEIGGKFVEGAVIINETSLQNKEKLITLKDVAPMSLAFSPDSKSLAIGSNGDLRIIDVQSSNEILRVEHSDGVPNLIFSKDGRLIASVDGFRGVISIYDIISRKEIARLQHDSKNIFGFDFNSDGKYLVTNDENSFIYIWEIETGKLFVKFKKEDSRVYFGQDDSLILTENNNISIQKWMPENLLNEACKRLSDNLTLKEWEKYLPHEEPHKTCENLP